MLDPRAFLRRMAALIPAPYANLVRYHGIFANRSRFRKLLPAPPESEADLENGESHDSNAELAKLDPSDCPESPIRPRHLSWAKLLRRVLDIDALTCPRCSTSMVVIAFLTNPPVLRLILDHLKLPSSPPQIAPARILTAEMDMVGNELSHDIEEHSHWQSGFSSLSRAPP